MISSLGDLVPWLSSGFLQCIARDSLYNSRDQWSDLSIILQLSYISSVLLVSIVLEESGVSANRGLIYWKCAQELMWTLISELSRVLCSEINVHINSCKHFQYIKTLLALTPEMLLV